MSGHKAYLTDSCLTCLTFSLNDTWDIKIFSFHENSSSNLHSETLMNFAGLFDVNTQLKKSILGKQIFSFLHSENVREANL